MMIENNLQADGQGSCHFQDSHFNVSATVPLVHLTIAMHSAADFEIMTSVPGITTIGIDAQSDGRDRVRECPFMEFVCIGGTEKSVIS